MKRTLNLVVACICLLVFLVKECNADCGGSRIGKRIQSGLSKVVGVKKATCSNSQQANCSASQPSSCSAPQSIPASVVVPVEKTFIVSTTVQPVTVQPIQPTSQPVVQPMQPDCSSGTCNMQESTVQSFQPIRNSIAQYKSNAQAGNGVMRHIGGSFGEGRYEGVGFSTVSADDAIKQCCYWGQRTPVDIGVARGANGWYATVLYR